MKKLLYLLSTLMLLSSCMDDKELLADLHHAETVMEAHPDSAYQLLVVHDSLQVSQQSRETRMRHQLLMAEATNKLYLQMPSDTLFQEVVDYYDCHGTPNQQLKAHYLLGCIYRDMKEAPMALQCYYDAIEKADTLRGDCDYYTLISVYGQMADLYDAQYMPNEEIETLEKVQFYAKKSGDTFTYIKGIELLCRPYGMLRDTTRILELADSVSNLYKKHGFLQEMSNAYSPTFDIYIARKQYAQANKLMEKFEEESYIFDVDYPDKSRHRAYSNLKGRYYQGTGQLHLADSIFRTLLGTENEFEGYDGLLSVFLKSGSSDSIIKYWSLYDNAFDEKYTTLYTQSMHQVAAMYDYTRHQHIAMEKAAESQRNRNIIYILIIITLIAALLFYHLHRGFKEKKKREIEKLSHQYMNILTQYEQAKEEKNILETDFSTFQQRKKEELEDLQVQLSDFQSRYGNLRQKEKLEALKQSPIWEAIMERLNPKKKSKPVTDKEWEKLSMLFNQCVPALHALMTEKKPLNWYEQRVTMLTRLGLSAKEIAILLDTFPQRVTNARESANNKLFSDTSARTFMGNISKL